MKIVLATHNKNKVEEIRDVLSEMLGGCNIMTMDEAGITQEVEENGITFEENAMLKARAVWSKGVIALADDSGLCVNALNGEPGILSARYAGEPSDTQKNNAKLLFELKNKMDRSAYFVCTFACIMPDGESFTVRGTVDGVILDEPRGNGGFGYDPLFLYEPLGKAFAELTKEEKHEVSHRGNALRLLKDELVKRL